MESLREGERGGVREREREGDSATTERGEGETERGRKEPRVLRKTWTDRNVVLLSVFD